ncbi:polyprenyl synthetase family protein [Azotosporobacter soli]|uniref:polyprenyl synthetase family protein n=1 Tax=Azotosporobacter soli TaxID=3055040 RepID=UPI0031FE6D43
MLVNYCQGRKVLIENAMREFLAQIHAPSLAEILNQSMDYSLFAGGKRLRPILLMAAAEAVGTDGRIFLPCACALEMIHTYSLIHDDLPAMDNDDFRRGKPTNHKVYGESIAILAGDALLTGAFELIAKQPQVAPEVLLRVSGEIAQAAGSKGMIGGQVIDILFEQKQADLATLQEMHRGKTGALFCAAIRSGALLADATDLQLKALTEYAENLGLAFQITDDILDVTGTQENIGKPVGSDVKNMKSTYATLFSLTEARQHAKNAIDSAVESLAIFGESADVLRELVRQLLSRNH